MITTTEAQLELHRIQTDGQLTAYTAAATAGSIPLALWIAIGSRETNCRNEFGDREGGQFHGVGPHQGDIQHPQIKAVRDGAIAAGRTYLTPDELDEVEMICTDILADGWNQTDAALPNLSDEESIKVAASAYNCGVQNAIQGYTETGDSDQYTTGHDYGADVVSRMQVFQGLLT